MTHRLEQARPVIYAATALGVALRLNSLLNWGFNNNWTKNTRATAWNWDDEIVLITGGSSGIGAILAQQLLVRNPRTRVVIVDYAPLAWTPPGDSRVSYYQCDLSDSSQLRAACAAVRGEVGHPTVLVNNAGVCRGFGICEGSHADIEFTIRTNLVAPFLLVQEFLPEMARRNHGHIVNMGSMSSLMAPSRMADYSATKAGLTALHEVRFHPAPFYFHLQCAPFYRVISS
ncbi:SDR family NAD(P)-dependent oxidoreductase [Candidatus Bathyarchaeota archaeon]|nr:SDR family NAD(P)-dependent oxidoreductase [Candidatus Bathyarchaeota archaeon]